MKKTDRSSSVRKDILKKAAPFLKRHGTDGAPVDKIMKAVGLTSGALYSQFESKEDLCTQAICSALDAMLEGYGRTLRKRGKEGLKLVVAQYLSKEHVAQVTEGCTFAALGSEMAKASPGAKRAYQARIQALVQLFVDALGAGPVAKRRAKAQQILSTMLGAVTFARTMADADAANEFLSQVRANTLRVLDQRRL